MVRNQVTVTTETDEVSALPVSRMLRGGRHPTGDGPGDRDSGTHDDDRRAGGDNRRSTNRRRGAGLFELRAQRDGDRRQGDRRDSEEPGMHFWSKLWRRERHSD